MAVSCLDSGEPALQHVLTAPWMAPPQPPATMIGSPLQVCQNNHQDSEATINCQIHLELYTTYISLPTSSCFDSDGVALKNIVKYFLQQSHEEREYDEKLVKLQNQQRGWIPNSSGYQETKPWQPRQQADWMQQNMHYTWKKRMNQSLLELHKLATDKNDTCLCDFTETLPEWADKIHQRIGWPQHQLAQDGGPQIRHGRVCLLQAHPGRQWQWELSDSHRVTFLSPRQCMHVGVTFTFSISCTKTSTYILSFVYSLN